MKKFILLLAVFLYADISGVLIKINKIESFKPKFKKIKFIKCNKPHKMVKYSAVNNNINNKFELKLMAIFGKKALINNKWLKEKDYIEGYKIVKIYSKKVLLKKDNKIIVLKFNNILLKVKK
jgi:hypothetical protein